MLDFIRPSIKRDSKGRALAYPKFIVRRSDDLMVRGGEFYAVWIEEAGFWSTDEFVAQELIDKEVDEFAKQKAQELEEPVRALYLWDAENKVIDAWHHYIKHQTGDHFVMLDDRLIFANTDVKKTDYASKCLPYPLEEGTTECWDSLVGTLYLPEEKHKIEWAIGAIVTGASKHLQKFMVFYGAAGTGKSTVLNIIQMLFEGYYAVFDAKALGSSTNAFALEAFRSNPLVAIQHDGDLSRIEDNTRLNSLVSHELMTVNEKYSKLYASSFRAFLLMGTNKPVKITDAKSGLIRRLIDVSPSGVKLGLREYNKLMKGVSFELGAIAWKCKDVFLDNPDYYNDYIPVSMMGASNDTYNFVLENFDVFQSKNGVSLKAAWEMYKQYCDEAKVPYPLTMRLFKEELKNYFKSFQERYTDVDGMRIRNYYIGFRTDRFDRNSADRMAPERNDILVLNCSESLLDAEYGDCLAQYATPSGAPMKKWDECRTKLKDIDTGLVHYVKMPENHIVLDFDISSNGEKDLQRNLEAASRFPSTYAELSKSGKGVHLHYIYNGDVARLSHVLDDHIEIKTFTGGSSLRRRLTLCNDIPIATISSGLPLKGEKMLTKEGVLNEKGLRTFLLRAINKEYHGDTRSSIDYIYKVLNDKYKSGEPYDISDLYTTVRDFAMHSTHQSEYCLKKVGQMHFKSATPAENQLLEDPENGDKLMFFDVEVFPNLFIICWKIAGPGQPVVSWINPSPEEVLELMKHRLIGFNNRRYDNHILYGRAIGYDNYQLYLLSKRIISGAKDAFFGAAYNLSYTDIYDFSAEKKSLKKFEIEYGAIHKELGMKWDEPVPEDKWQEVADYCKNDVISTEITWNNRQPDFIAREVLADVAGMTVNDTTNSLTTRIIFGKERSPQSEFNYRNMGDVNAICSSWLIDHNLIFHPPVDEFTVFDAKGRPIFPGYTYNGKSTYREEEVGEGGYVYAEPGIHYNVALDDIASMHPHSIIAEELFGPRYTKIFKELVDARVAVKHKDFDAARNMLGGKLGKYLTDEKAAKDLAQALKIAINSVYGLTSAKFDNPFRDPRNIDNIVAKRGALFMVNLKHEVQKRGFTVAHIKTDSIKIPGATNDILQFVQDYGKMYGYTFELEDVYEKMCLVNDAVYVAKYKEPHKDKVTGKDIWWTATGTQFQVPYVFKTLFSHEDIDISDMTETKQVSTAIYLDMNEHLPEGEHNYVFVGRVGAFNPVKAGCGGGEMVAERVDKDGNVKYDSVTGTKGYRWLEAGMCDVSDIDRSYYDKLVDKAVDTIAKYGDVEAFLE